MLTSSHQLVAAIEEDRHRGEARRHAHERALREARVERPALAARLAALFAHAVRRDRRSVTDLACRLPDGKTGVTAFVLRNGEWLMVCRVA